jgi:hypothetical protein
MVRLPRKPTLICLVVFGVICVADGISKNDIKETVLMFAVLIFAAVSLINDRRKKLAYKRAQVEDIKKT